LGFFRAGDVRGPLSVIVGREVGIPNFQRHLNEFSKPARGPALVKEGSPRHYRYQFRDPLLQQFVKLRALDRGLVTDAQYAALQAAQPVSRPDTLFDLDVLGDADSPNTE
jgi:hypothetical protein